MTFVDMCNECISNKDLVKQWNRLTGHELGVSRSFIVTAVDKACGYDPDMEAMPEFVHFVFECIWMPLMKK